MISTPSLPQKLNARECAAAVTGSPHSSSRCVPGQMRCSTPQLPVFAQQVAIAVAQETARAGAELHQPGRLPRPGLGCSSSRMSA